MKRLAVCALSAGLLVAVGQETAHPENGKHETAGEKEEPSPLWAWANFAMLAGVLGYLAAKKGGPFFAERAQSIRKGIADAEEIRKSAEARAAEVDRKLAGMAAEIESLRAEAGRERAKQAERLREQTAAELARIEEHAGREIESAGKSARIELKRYAGQLALDLAEQKIRRQMTPEVQAVLVENFARDLERP